MLWQCDDTVFTQAGFRVRRFCCLLQLFFPVIRTQNSGEYRNAVCQCLKKSKLRHTLRLCCFLRAFCDLIFTFLLGYSETFRGIVAVLVSNGNYRHHSVIVISQTAL